MSASLTKSIMSPKGAALLVPAILLVGGALFIGQKAETTPAPQAVAPIAPTVLQPSPAAATTAQSTATPVASPTSATPEKPTVGGAFSAAQRKELNSIIKEFLLNNPDVLLDAQAVLDAKMENIQTERMASAIKENANELYRPANSPVVGNARGDVPVIEFFDYNCGFCKKAFPEVAKLVEKDKKLRLILKEFPILAKGSEEASRVALAAKLQGKYWEFHRAMLENQGQANEASALRVAEKLGLDMARLKRDMASPDIKKEIDETRKLANKIGIQGTPHFIVGDRVIAGAPENLPEVFEKHVSDVRKDGCKVC